MNERVLVTGGSGCIGAWICKLIVAAGDIPVAADISRDDYRLREIMSPEEFGSVHRIELDITDQKAVLDAAAADGGVSRIIHTAALQVPYVRENPTLGAMVNVVGTANVFNAAKVLGIDHVVFASSIAVYGPPDLYPTSILPADAALAPAEHYGVHKQCNEGAAKIYWAQDGVSSIGLRPHTVYGPGRDRGLTAGPTFAMRAAARGESFTIGYGGRAGFVYVEDVAKVFVLATTVPFQGAEVYGIKGQVAHMSEVVDKVTEIAGCDPGQIDFEPTELPFPAGMDDAELRGLLGEVPDRSLDEGIELSIEHFAAAFNAENAGSADS